jgi:hypothetical protein
VRARALVAAGIAFAIAKLSLAGCSDAGSHIYTGAPYDPTLACLAPLTGVDVVTGPEPENPCGPICVVSPPEDGGVTVYVSTMCAPYPNYPNVVNPSGNAACAAALEAFQLDALCEDGGVVYPNGRDSGSDADAGPVLDADVDATVLDANVPDAPPNDAGGDAEASAGDATSE